MSGSEMSCHFDSFEVTTYLSNISKKWVVQVTLDKNSKVSHTRHCTGDTLEEAWEDFNKHFHQDVKKLYDEYVTPKERCLGWDVRFYTEWSEEDGEYVGLCNFYPYLSFLHTNRTKALAGIMLIVADIIAEEEKDAEEATEKNS